MTLSMIVGLPKGGKTTYAKTLMEKDADAVLISYDEIRDTVDASVEDIKEETLKLVAERMDKAFSEGKNVVYDHTNVTRGTRKVALYIAKKYEVDTKTEI